MLSGLCAAVLWPRFGVTTLYSALGVSLILLLGLSALNFSRPQWIGMLPGRTAAQVMTLLGLVAFGALVQWRIGPAHGAEAGGSSGKPPPSRRKSTPAGRE